MVIQSPFSIAALFAAGRARQARTLDILKERLARGKIDVAELRARKRALGERSAPRRM
jgi:uncharacterized membrane protein